MRFPFRLVAIYVSDGGADFRYYFVFVSGLRELFCPLGIHSELFPNLVPFQDYGVRTQAGRGRVHATSNIPLAPVEQHLLDKMTQHSCRIHSGKKTSVPSQPYHEPSLKCKIIGARVVS